MDNYEIYTPHIETDEPPVITPAPEEKPEEPKGKGNNAKGKKVKTPKKPKNPQNPPSVGFHDIVKNIKTFFTSPALRQITGIFLGCLAVYLLISFISYFSDCIKDQSIINSTPVGGAVRIANRGGEGGARLSEILINRSFGVGSFVIIFWLGAMCLKLLTGHPRFKSVNFTIKCLVALLTVSLIVGITGVVTNTYVNWGGYHAHYVYEYINNFIGYGSYILCFFMVALFVLICLNDLVTWIRKKYAAHMEKRRILAEEKAAERAREEALRREAEKEHREDVLAGDSIGMDDPVEEQDYEPEKVSFPGSYTLPDELPEDEDDLKSIQAGAPSYLDELNQVSPEDKKIGEEHPIAEEPQTETTESVIEPEPVIEQEAVITEKPEIYDNPVEEDLPEDEVSEEEPEDTPSQGGMVVNVNQIAQAETKHFKSEIEYWESKPYKFPPYNILRESSNKISVDAEEQLENKVKIEKALLDYNIPIVDISATVGPTVTLYEIIPDKGVKIARIRSLSDDLALRLGATGVRIIAPIPGKGTVGIEVPNKDPLTVSMQTVIRSKKFQESKYILPIAIGSTISNEVYMADLAKMPHLLVAGATGQGKSVGLNAIIASLMYCRAPYQLKFVMIDPKQVEFSLYNKLRDHYFAVIPEDQFSDEPVITDMKKVEATLNALCIEMDDRYTLLKNAQTRNIEEYNAKIKEGKLNPAEGHRFLPYIVVIVDEFGDLVMVAGKNVETPIARLAQKARAVGMHVIIATQRPSTNVITGIIKANFPARMSFKVSSGVDSKTILDATGAQHLIGRGDMLIFHNSDMVRVQCAFIDTPEVEAICDYVSRQPNAPGVYLLPEPPMGGEEGAGAAGGGPVGDRDPLFEEAARKVVSANTASTSSLQRIYSIGYNRAGKIMDQMEAAGIVGPSQGGKPRAVLVDMIGLENILSSL